MSTGNEDSGVLDAAVELKDAVVDAVESGRAADIAQGVIEDTTALVKGGVEAATDAVTNLTREDITPDKIREAFAENAFDGVVALAGGAGIKLGVAAVETVFNQAEGDPYKAIHAHFFSPETAETNAETDVAQAQGSWIERILAGDISGVFSDIFDKINVFEKFAGALQSFIPSFDISGTFKTIKGMLGMAQDSIQTQFSGASDQPASETPPTQPVDTAVITQPGEGGMAEPGRLTATQLAATQAGAGSEKTYPAPEPETPGNGQG